MGSSFAISDDSDGWSISIGTGGGSIDAVGGWYGTVVDSEVCSAVADRVARTVLAAGKDIDAMSFLAPLNEVPHIAHSFGLIVRFWTTPDLFFPLPFLGLGLGLIGPVESTTCLNPPQVLHHAV
jgi:hypothetical protein